MGRDHVETRLLDFIDRVLLDGQGVGLTPSTPLFAFGLLDSFALFRIISFITEEFKIPVKLESLRSEDFESVSSIAGFVCSRVSAAVTSAECEG